MVYDPNQALADALANIAYQSGNIRNRYTEGIDKWNMQRQALVPKMQSGFARRGVVNSGIKQKGFGDFARDTEAGQAQMRRNLDDALFNLVGQQLSAYNVYGQTQFDDALRRAQTAAGIREATQ